MSKRSARIRGRGGDEETDIGEVYRVSFTSLIILLLAFFVFLVSLTTPDVIKAANVRDSLDEQFTQQQEQAESEDARQLAALAEAANFKVQRGSDRMLITLPGSGVFESGSDIIRAEVLPALEKIANLVRELDVSVIIEGHTDNIPIQTPQFPSNWELSAARATSVLRILLNHGVPSDRLAAAGRAEFLPVASNDSDEGRALNRRVTLLISSSGIAKQKGA